MTWQVAATVLSVYQLMIAKTTQRKIKSFTYVQLHAVQLDLTHLAEFIEKNHKAVIIHPVAYD